MTQAQAYVGFSWGHTPTQRAYRQSRPAPIAPPQHRPFSKPPKKAKPDSVTTLRAIKKSPYPSGPGREAMDGLPPMDPSRMISRPEPSMSDAAMRLFKMLAWFEICINDRQLESEAYVTECRIREQAAHIIGFLA